MSKPDDSVEKPEGMSDDEWDDFGKPHEYLEYDENEQPKTLFFGLFGD
jgi:hypothetical protein